MSNTITKRLTIGRDESNGPVTLELRIEHHKPEVATTGETIIRRTVDLEPITEYKRLIISGESRRGGGQMQNTIRAEMGNYRALYIPRENLIRILDIWDRYHLGDMQSGTRRQSAIVNARFDATGEWYDYTRALAILADLPPYHVERRADDNERQWVAVLGGRDFATYSEAVNLARGLDIPPEDLRIERTSLVVDRGYKYGSAWLVEALPPEIEAEVLQLFTEAPVAATKGTTRDDDAGEVLAGMGLEFRAVLVGNDCPMFCDDAEKDHDMEAGNTFPRRTHIHGKHYRCTISGKGRGHFTIDYWNRYADEEYNHVRRWFESTCESFELLKKYQGEINERKRKAKTPTPYDVLACIQKSDPGGFADFCGEYGYDADSLKAENAYRAVMAEWRKVSRFFSAAELETLAEIS